METTTITIVDDDYAWGQCAECGNTIKFGTGDHPCTSCAGCGGRYRGNRADATATLEYMPSDEEFWEEEDSYLDY